MIQVDDGKVKDVFSEKGKVMAISMDDSHPDLSSGWINFDPNYNPSDPKAGIEKAEMDMGKFYSGWNGHVKVRDMKYAGKDNEGKWSIVEHNCPDKEGKRREATVNTINGTITYTEEPIPIKD